MTLAEQANLLSLLDAHRAGDDDPLIHVDHEVFTAGEIRSSAADLADLLSRHGLAPGQPVAALVTTAASAVAAMFGVWAAQGVYVPVNSRLSDTEVGAVLAEVRPAAVIGSPDQLNRALPVGLAVEAADSLEWRARGAVDTNAPQLGDDVALVMRTSGTTGSSKAVLLRHSGTLDALAAVVQRLGNTNKAAVNEPTPNLIPVSLALWAGVYNVLFAMSVGARIVMLSTFSVRRLVELIRQFEIRSTVLAPAMITMLTEDPEVADVAPLRFIRSITAPLSPRQARRCFDRFGVSVLNSYGQTELGGEVVGWTARDVKEFGNEKLGAVGRPHPGIVVSIRDDQKRELSEDAVGEVWVRSPFVMDGYLATPADTNVADRLDDGFLRTGDIGRVDPDGFLWIEGRVSDMINRGGLKVMPDEVEAVLAAHPAIREACVAGRADERLGEVPVAWVVLAGSVDAGELDSWCREQLAAYKVPVEFRAVEALPRSEIGKVLRRRLATSNDGAPLEASQAGLHDEDTQDVNLG